MNAKLTDLPNIGKAIAADLQALGIDIPEQLRGTNALQVFNDLGQVMGHRHDPCVYYTLLSVEHFFATGKALPWWQFTTRGKADLHSQAQNHRRLTPN